MMRTALPLGTSPQPRRSDTADHRHRGARGDVAASGMAVHRRAVGEEHVVKVESRFGFWRGTAEAAGQRGGWARASHPRSARPPS